MKVNIEDARIGSEEQLSFKAKDKIFVTAVNLRFPHHQSRQRWRGRNHRTDLPVQ